MENVLKQGDMVVMEKFSEIRRFDIVVFQLADGTIYIKTSNRASREKMLATKMIN